MGGMQTFSAAIEALHKQVEPRPPPGINPNFEPYHIERTLQ